MRTVSSLLVWLRDVVSPVRIAARVVRSAVVFVVASHALLFALVLVSSIVLLRWNPPVTALMVYRDITVHQKARPLRFVPLRQIPRVARSMVIRLEDYRFYFHHGVDLGAIRDAWMINSSIHRTAVGGSTIPMQLARNLFLTPRKTYLRKYIEAVTAVEMVMIIPKDRILELYLNCIEWGKGVFGIGAASAYYYKTGVGGLGIDELRRLATIITNPLRYDVQTFQKSAQMSQRYLYLLSHFPDPAAEPTDRGPVAPIPDTQVPETPIPPGRHPAGASGPGPLRRIFAATVPGGIFGGTGV